MRSAWSNLTQQGSLRSFLNELKREPQGINRSNGHGLPPTCLVVSFLWRFSHARLHPIAVEGCDSSLNQSAPVPSPAAAPPSEDAGGSPPRPQICALPA